MLLVIDVGNTNMEFGVYRGEELVGSFRLMTDANRTSDELGLWLCQYFQRFGLELGQVEDVVIGSVAPQVMHTLSRAVQKYVGKTVRFLAQVCQTNRAGKNSFVPGRFAMTCCVQDIQFVGFPCSYDGYKALEQRAWVTVTAKVNYKFHNIYRGKGPVLTAISVEPAEKPQNDVVTFS